MTPEICDHPGTWRIARSEGGQRHGGDDGQIGEISVRYRIAEISDVTAVAVPTRPSVFFGVYTVAGYGHLARCHRLARALVARVPVAAYVFGRHHDFEGSERVPAVDELDLSDAPPSSGEATHGLSGGKAGGSGAVADVSVAERRRTRAGCSRAWCAPSA